MMTLMIMIRMIMMMMMMVVMVMVIMMIMCLKKSMILIPEASIDLLEVFFLASVPLIQGMAKVVLLALKLVFNLLLLSTTYNKVFSISIFLILCYIILVFFHKFVLYLQLVFVKIYLVGSRAWLMVMSVSCSANYSYVWHQTHIQPQ